MFLTRWFMAAAPLLAWTAPASQWTLAQGVASAPAASAPDPLNAQAAVPAVSAPRTFDHYHAYRDTGPAPWRETNAAVSPKPSAASGHNVHGAHAGHAGHAMSASEPAASPATPAGNAMPGMHHH
ncbi:hypothetical protein [Ralstonia flaminis]|jgi:hypothetical protein|uniref:Uncharacterized protein n=1 Tax=Ralstonia flaminis TaxID=3058597 RepID=A0ABM9K664_9RALS|nr:hypothetical protein [Ralstonia sp. LMG 18101]CAJ0815147.1 hypothetical protein LMG18101_02490 [Ralstonia sp. LMG 18101]